MKEVGFGSLSNHFLKRSKRDGADFNLLVIGPAGCGKSTLLSNLYNQEILPSDRRRYVRIPNSIEFIDNESVVAEAGVELRLNVTEVLGYGELSFESCGRTQKDKIQKILKNVEEKHRQHFDGENYAKRPQKDHQSTGRDQLYHAAILFIQPQRNLEVSPYDIALLQALQSRVNVIPVISKADSYIGEELCRIKTNLKKAFNDSKILLFPNITDVSDDDWVIKEAVDVRSHCPFVTIAASLENGNRSRQYPWGLVSIDAPVPRQTKLVSANSSHSLTLTSTARLFEQTECCGNDLFPMQKMLIRSHFEFLKRHTVEKLYENYRTEIVCHVPVAPEAPMRLNKSRENLKDTTEMPAPIEQQNQQVEPQLEIQAPVLVQVQDEIVQELQSLPEYDQDEEDELFQSTPLSPIKEEDEPVKLTSLNFSTSIEILNTDKKSKKMKKSSSNTLKKLGSDNLGEEHDDLVSPLPSIQ